MGINTSESYGYAGKILRVDLSSKSVSHIPTLDYAEMFIGGVGIAAKIFWDEVSPETSAFDPENRLMFMNGPLAGFPGLAGSRWVVCGKCPTTDPEHFGYSNFGGRWGAQLKLAGYDGIVIYGKSDKRVFLLIKDQTVQIKDAADLWGKGSVQTREILKNRLGEKFAVAACGPAGENMVVFGTILADNDASGSSGLGAVMGSKNLKAVAVMGSGKVVTAYPERLKEVRKYVHKLWKGFRVPGDKRCEAGKQKKDPCYGCFGDCPRAIRILEDGTRHKSLCVPPASFHIIGSIYYGDMNQMPAFEVPLQATILLDDYGLDAFTMLSCLGWIVMCSHAKVLTEETSGLPLSKFGSLEFMETLIKKIALREGFGDILAQGVLKAADSFGEVSKALLMKSWVPVGRDGRAAVYCPRLFPANGMIYATEPSMRIQQLHEMSYLLHRWLFWADENFRKTSTLAGPERFFVSSEVFRKIAKKFWGSELAADFSTYEDKALAAKKIQDRSYAKESLILCDYLFPITSISSGDYVGDPTVESKIFSAVTGYEVDEDGLNLIGERIFNLKRAITIMEGHKGRQSDNIPENMFTTGLADSAETPNCLVPGKDGEPISLTGAVVDRDKFENMKDEYYQLRGWDVTSGLQTKTKLEELGLKDVAQNLGEKGLISVSSKDSN